MSSPPPLCRRTCQTIIYARRKKKIQKKKEIVVFFLGVSLCHLPLYTAPCTTCFGITACTELWQAGLWLWLCFILHQSTAKLWGWLHVQTWTAKWISLLNSFLLLCCCLWSAFLSLFLYFLNGEGKTSGVKEMDEFRFPGSGTNIRIDEFVREKFLNECTM